MNLKIIEKLIYVIVYIIVQFSSLQNLLAIIVRDLTATYFNSEDEVFATGGSLNTENT